MIQVSRDNQEGQLIFTVFHQHFLGKNTYLGRLCVSLFDLVKMGEISAWKRLDYECYKQGEAGQLEISISYKETLSPPTRIHKPSLSSILNNPVMDLHMNMAKREKSLYNNRQNTVNISADNTFEGSHGKYKICGAIGQGAFGKVMKGETVDTREVVAIKIMKQEGTEFILKAMAMEIQILHLLSNEYCVSVIESLESKDSFLIIMEFCSGGDLFEALPLPLPPAKKATIDILRGLQYLHGAGVCHRDIKPENIFLSSEGTWKIADFGISTFFTDDNSTMRGEMGSIPYMAPEMFHSTYTQSIDLWATGVTLFVVLTGQFPWNAEMSNGFDEDEVTAAILKVDIRWTVETWVGMEEAKDFITKLLESNTKKRMKIDEAFGHAWITQ